MPSITISSLTELRDFVERSPENHPKGTVVHISGDISQAVSKAYNAYHKLMRQKLAAVVGGSAGFVVLLGTGPLGWAAGLLAGGSIVTAMKTSDHAHSEYAALPCSYEVWRLGSVGYDLTLNDGSTVILERCRGASRDFLEKVAYLLS